jgi:hypothetical protein
MSKLDEYLRQEIRAMTPRSGLFRILKEELSALGYWRNRPRGNPKKGYAGMRASMEKKNGAN